MNINQLPPGSYTPVPQNPPATPQASPQAPQQGAPLNINNLPAGATTPVQQDPGVLGDLGSGNILGAVKDAADWALPIISDAASDIQGTNHKTALQQIGDAGLSALWFIPGFGDAADAAIEGGKAAVEGASTLAKVGEGAAVGYGADVASKLSSGNTNAAQVLTPGLGALSGGIAGGVLPKIFDALGSKFTEEGAVQNLQDNLQQTLASTKTGAKFLSATEAAGSDPVALLAHTMSIPDVIDGRFNTDAAAENITKNLNQLGQLRASVLDTKIGAGIPLEDLHTEALAQVPALAATGETQRITSQIDAKFDDFKTTYGDMLTPSQIEKIKETQASASGIYKRTGQIGEQNASSIIGNVARTKIETLADSAGFDGMKEYNKLMADHYKALDALKIMHGQTVKGGRLGNILRGHTMAGISALGASTMGGGFLGTLAGGLGGEATGAFIAKIMGDTALTNPLRDAILERIGTENPAIVQRLQDFAEEKSAEAIAPVLKPKVTKPIRATKILVKAVGRAGASGNQNA